MNKTVLVVDDDMLVRQSLVEELSSRGVNVEQAADGQEGLKKVNEAAVDLVITDIRMPRMDGVQLAEEIRKGKSKDIPVIIMTVDEETTSLNQALEAGVTVYLSKVSQDATAIADQVLTALGQQAD